MTSSTDGTPAADGRKVEIPESEIGLATRWMRWVKYKSLHHCGLGVKEGKRGAHPLQRDGSGTLLLISVLETATATAGGYAGNGILRPFQAHSHLHCLTFRVTRIVSCADRLVPAFDRSE